MIRIQLTLGVIAALAAAGIAVLAGPARAHLDQTGPQAVIEAAFVTTALLTDDMDNWGAGEIWLDGSVWPARGHPHGPSRIRVPPAGHVSLSAPPAVGLPGILPGLLIYTHLNCWPVERPITLSFTFNDDDWFGNDSVSAARFFGPVGGNPITRFRNGSLVLVTVAVFRLPQFDRFCSRGATVPPNLPTPSLPPRGWPRVPDGWNPSPDQVPPLPEGDGN